METMRILKPFRDSTQLWKGLEEEGMRRKVFKVVTEERLGAKNLTAGITIFEPGEGCEPHIHPGSEEVHLILRGSGIAHDMTNGIEIRYTEGDWIFIPKDILHRHYNDGDETLWLLWCYAPPGEPTDKNGEVIDMSGRDRAGPVD